MNMEGEDAIPQTRKRKERKKGKKCELSTGEELTDGNTSTSRKVEDDKVETRKDYCEKKKKKNREKHKNEDNDLGTNDDKYALVESGEVREKKKRKLGTMKYGEPNGDNEATNVKVNRKEKERKREKLMKDEHLYNGDSKAMEGKITHKDTSLIECLKNNNLGTSKDEESEVAAEVGWSTDEKKKRKKEKRRKNKEVVASTWVGDKEVENDSKTRKRKSPDKEESMRANEGERGGIIKKKKEKMNKEGSRIESLRIKGFDEVFAKGNKSIADEKETSREMEYAKEDGSEKLKCTKKVKKKEKKNTSESCFKEVIYEKRCNKRKVNREDKIVADNQAHVLPCSKNVLEKEVFDTETQQNDGKNKRKKAKVAKERICKQEDRSEGCQTKGTSKRVKFSSHVEVFPPPDATDFGEENKKTDLVRGKRFSKEEDEIVKKAVLNYIERHSLGEEGLKMVLHCRLYPEIKNCWKEIGTALPWRPYVSVYYRAHLLFERADDRKWIPEEYELIKRVYEKHGADWKMVADQLGRHRFHVKDTWRRLKVINRRKGQWTQDEYQNLFDLVNMDLRMKAFEERKSKHGMLRDNIRWGAISDKLGTRPGHLCCSKWYGQLTSYMVSEGNWADVDDYRLLNALLSLDACCMEDVDWDNLLEHRSGDLCRKRWNQMVHYLGEHKTESFAEQLEILSQRYCPDVLEPRLAYDSKPVIP
ncbi:PREDICTED: RNA polymerase I termination factor [Nelumbo nucifera]|uniref:RNA polymerase I termination factor n=2 Tax=Nelumbo nucifera TaxID=4432 RepID=A0A1U7ZTN8_NELNU|nr:PREDICTED: RNA polymerase I termination factor [Nelumbo nucifera]DAD43137.1 TPA_asm: hypothetical protein HUJ06_001367 [Nelumbo nucifera]